MNSYNYQLYESYYSYRLYTMNSLKNHISEFRKEMDVVVEIDNKINLLWNNNIHLDINNEISKLIKIKNTKLSESMNKQKYILKIFKENNFNIQEISYITNI